MWYIYTMEFYAAERKEPLPFMTAQMELESIMISEISQVVKDKYNLISLMCGSNEQTLQTRKMGTDS